MLDFQATGRNHGVFTDPEIVGGPNPQGRRTPRLLASVNVPPAGSQLRLWSGLRDHVIQGLPRSGTEGAC